MKIVIAPDKFKGSLSGFDFCDAVEEGILKVNPAIEIIKLPLADGGDGIIAVISHYLKGEKHILEVNDPLFRPIAASYLYAEPSKIAFIEMAEASGLRLLNKEDQNCMYTSSFGTGELIKDAIKKGAQEVILGIGGSATNDCGIGMASALGYEFLDIDNRKLNPIGANLSKIYKIDTSKVDSTIFNVSFKVAYDVVNPLYGKRGAAYVYAPQKGANDKEVQLLDKGLKDFSKVINKQFNLQVEEIIGGGAAGGMGVGAKAFLKADLTSGIDLVMELSKFSKKIKGASWIITGEGKLDVQTFSGKTISGVIKHSKSSGIPVAALCGSVDLSIEEQEALGLGYVSSIIKSTGSLEDTIEKSYENLVFSAYNFMLTNVHYK